MITVYCGLFFMADQPEIYNSDDPQINSLDNGLKLTESMKIVMFVGIVTSNCAFLGYWCFKMYKEVRIVLLKKMEKIYLVLFVCMNTSKLKRD